MNASTRPSIARRTRSIARTLSLATAGIVVPVVAIADDAVHDSPSQLVDSLHSAFGDHHSRAVHAKGVVLEGRFEPAAEARSLSKATLFTVKSTPVTVRFSDFTGIPDIPDNIPDANPRGLAIKFRAADSTQTDIVMHSFNGFPVATADEFGQLMRAIGASGPGAAKPTPIELFLAAHPAAKTFLSTQKPPPESYATAAYFGVNAFKFVDASGHATLVRYRFVPKAGEHYLDAGALAGKGPDYLVDEMPLRVAKSPVQFDWYAQIAEPGDAIDNPTIAWPESRRLVKLGTLTIDRAVGDQAAAGKALLFLPSRVPTGIEPADPMIAVRTAAYPISFAHRQ